MPNGVDLSEYKAIPQSEALAQRKGPNYVFPGKMDFRPNVDAAVWFAQSALPLIRRQLPEARFWVVGRSPHPSVLALRQLPNVDVTGEVPDTRPYIAGATAVVHGVTLFLFDYDQADKLQFAVDHEWISVIRSGYTIGLDGISLPLLVLSCFVTVLAVIYSWDHWEEPRNPRAFLMLMMRRVSARGVQTNTTMRSSRKPMVMKRTSP